MQCHVIAIRSYVNKDKQSQVGITQSLNPDELEKKIKKHIAEIEQELQQLNAKRKQWHQVRIVTLGVITIAVLLVAFYMRGKKLEVSINLPAGGANNYMVVHPEKTGINFSHVKGIDEVKEELETVVKFLKDPKKYSSMGAKIPKGVLMVGPPGCGKTFLAKATAGEAGVSFFYAAGSSFDEMYVGVGAKRIRDLFDAAKANAPCIIFIDEIDSVGVKRSQSNSFAYQTLHQLLNELDGFNNETGVIVIAATNRPNFLD
ncbi:uncharacterized protein LOC134234631, partial [Saccostrea cucullata]|uniref:uncharacterized protein LOC134234631 n=1 Tax=Saccostrea cuccullata TaxID=36930 RepID=UPI002ED1A6B1